MQGKKDCQEKLFAQFQLSERIPKDNFYRRLKDVLDLDFLYPLTKGYYGESGQRSIEPVVFMCVDRGMVSGHTQAIDSAPVKANASMDTLELKVPEEELESHLRKAHHISSMDREEPYRKSKGDRSDRAVRYNGKQQGARCDEGPQKEVGEGPGPKAGCWEQGLQIYQQQNALQPTDPMPG